MEVSINYLAVIVSAIALLIVSFVWYGPLFGKAWMAAVGFDKATPEEMEKGKKEMPKNAAIQFVTALIMAYVMTHTLTYAGAYLETSGLILGLMTGFWLWLGFVVPVSIGSVLWDGKPWKYWFIVAGNWLVNFLVVGAILAMWM